MIEGDPQLAQADQRSLLEWGAIVQAWLSACPPVTWADLTRQGKMAVVVVDMLTGFCREGPLSSARIGALTVPVAEFVKQAAARDSLIVRLEDAHTVDAGEFHVYPVHCLDGTNEAHPVEELRRIPAFDTAIRYPKNALTVFDRVDLEQRLVDLSVHTVVVVGDCTDLCVEACAMPLKLYANARVHDLRVVVPADLVDTFDAPGHPGDWTHAFALYRMHQNGIDVVSTAALGS